MLVCIGLCVLKLIFELEKAEEAIETAACQVGSFTANTKVCL